MPMCGGLGGAKPANPEVQAIVDEIKEELEKRSGQNFCTFKAVEYKTQLVAGTNYFVKVHAGDQDYVHVRIYKMLPHAQEKLSLTAFQLGRTREDEIVHFEP
ncbi:cystatin-A-like [Rhinophrynus dorsalis]